MIPIQLELEGIFSYKEKQVIDFSRLTESGLFGIFGSVGSGKSSILEAMMLALFGEPDRLSMRTERAGLIHLQAAGLKISFDFQSGTANEKYRCVFELKRKKKNPEELESSVRRFYVFQHDDWKPLDVADASEILKMSKDDFRRTIIIPQGKFREFVELKKAERTDMLRDLFGLQKFDLSPQTKSLITQSNTSLQFLRGELSTVSHLDEQMLHALKESIAANAHEILSLEKKLQETRVALQSQDEIKRIVEVIATKQNALTLLQQRFDEMQSAQTALDMHIKLAIEVFPLMKQIRVAEEENNALNNTIHTLEQQLSQSKHLLAELKPQFEQLEIEQQKRSEKEERIRFLDRLIQRNDTSFKLKELEDRAKDEQGQLDELQRLKSLFLSSKGEALTSLAAKKELIYQVEHILPELRIAIRRFGDLTNEKVKWQNIEVQLKAETNAIDNKIAEIFTALGHPSLDSLESFSKQLTSEIAALEIKVDALREKEGLTAFAHLVIEGEACPLCGSVHHPKVAVAQQDELHKAIELLKAQREKYYQLQTQLESIVKWNIQLESFTRENNRINDELQRIAGESNELLLQWEQHGWNGFEAASAGLKHLEEERAAIKILQEAYAQWDAKDKEVDETLSVLKMKLEVHQNERAGFIALLENFTKELESLKEDWWKRYMDVPADEIRRDIDKVKRFLDEIAMRYNQVRDQLNNVQSAIIRDETALASARERSESLSASLNNFTDTLNSLLKNIGVDMQFAQQAIQKNVSIDQEQKRLSEYFRTLDQLKQELETLSQTQGLSSFDPEQHALLKTNLLQLEQEWSETNSRKGSLIGQQEAIEKGLKLKSELEAKALLLESRLDGLKDLERLFSGRGFVAFIAQFYLKELCESANKRFLKLTRNRLSLEVDEDNEFFVRDFLNEGKIRSLKTLSGGQTFQASLCLALALSERVKSVSQSERSFFFLDEGFGSLDRDSLSIVMETIKSLRDEHRVVGLISHVEEMKEEMGVYLEVKLDQERGSLITLRP